MTTKRVVADDLLGKIARKTWELTRRVLQGSLDPNRVLRLLQQILEGVPEPDFDGSTYGTYVLESHWAYDNTHTEFATIALEKSDSPIAFEEILNPSASTTDKENLLSILERIFRGHVPEGEMVRLYRVLSTRTIGHDGHNLPRTVGRVVDVHLIMKPICDFDEEHKPIPCAIDRG